MATHKKKVERISKTSAKIMLLGKPRYKAQVWAFEVLDDLEYPLIAKHTARFGGEYYIIAREHWPYGFYIGRLDHDTGTIDSVIKGKTPWMRHKSIRFPSGDEYFFANQTTGLHEYDRKNDRVL